MTLLRDTFGRQITYLRLSVTDRFDLRCTYCMAEEMKFLPKRDVLSLEELERLAGAFIDRGVRKIRITGGEPPGRGFASLTRTGRQLLGTYEETMTLFGLATSGAANEKSYAMKGAFVLNRISDIATLETE